jgi:protein SCO1/2
VNRFAARSIIQGRELAARLFGSQALGLGLALALAGLLASCSKPSAESPEGAEHAAHHEDHGSAKSHADDRDEAPADPHAGHGDSADPHAAHRAALEKSKKAGYTVTTERYSVPDVKLLDESGKSVALPTLLESDEPVALNFIFTTCTTICPVMTATFAQMQRELGDDAERVHLISITIDPEYDRPDVLASYATQFQAGGNWTFLTGDTNDIVNVLRGFDAYTGSKMSHRPITLLKRADSDSWIRIDGLASGQSLAHEVTSRLLN